MRDLVLRDKDGDAWVYVGNGRYEMCSLVQGGGEWSTPWTRDAIEAAYGPVIVEFSEEEK